LLFKCFTTEATATDRTDQLSTAKDAKDAKCRAVRQHVTDRVTKRVLDAAYAVHSALGPGLLESTYDACLRHQFTQDQLEFASQVRLPVTYRGLTIDAGYRIDFLVENCVIIELKSVEKLLFLHKAQLLSYLKLSGHCVGLLINFNVPHLKEGIRRVVNGYPQEQDGHAIP
jgi:GxxExxY protein